MQTVMVFGTFDGLHEGHKAMLAEARLQGGKLIAVVAKDAVVERLKGRVPKRSLNVRIADLLASGFVDDAFPGDDGEGEYAVINQVNPTVVAFGYDQDALRENFLKFLERTGKTVTVVTLAPFQPEVFKSSKINSTSSV